MKNNQTCTRIFADITKINFHKKEIKQAKAQINDMSKILALAGNEVRLKILYVLKDENELCPCDLSDILNMSIPAVSQHLRKMKDGNLIEGRREGQTIFYSLIKEKLMPILPLLETLKPQNLKSNILTQ